MCESKVKSEIVSGANKLPKNHRLEKMLLVFMEVGRDSLQELVRNQ